MTIIAVDPQPVADLDGLQGVWEARSGVRLTISGDSIEIVDADGWLELRRDWLAVVDDGGRYGCRGELDISASPGLVKDL